MDKNFLGIPKEQYGFSTIQNNNNRDRNLQNRAKEDFMSFVKCVWPEFIEGAHHRIIAQKFNDLANGKIND